MGGYIHVCVFGWMMQGWIYGYLDGWTDASTHPSIHPPIQTSMHISAYTHNIGYKHACKKNNTSTFFQLDKVTVARHQICDLFDTVLHGLCKQAGLLVHLQAVCDSDK